jgi:Tol biopolymer transport system component
MTEHQHPHVLRRDLTAVLAGSVAGAGALGAAPPVGAALRDPELISVSPGGAPADGEVGPTTLASADGRYVAFTSGAENLGGVHRPPGDGISVDVYVRDRSAGTTTMVSTDAAGSGAGALLMDFSADGRHVLLMTPTALTADDTDTAHDLYVRDLDSGAYTLVSEGAGWREDVRVSPFGGLSDDGRSVAFLSDADRDAKTPRIDYYDVYVRHVEEGTTEMVSVTRTGRRGGGRLPQISSDGRFVAFDSRNARLVRRDTNGKRDVFVRDLRRNRTERVSVSSSSRQGNRGLENGLRISDDGRYVAFGSQATNLVRHDTNRAPDVFVRDRKRDVTRRISVATRGKQAKRGAWLDEMSASGRYVVFRTASHLGGPRSGRSSDEYVRDRKTGRTRYLKPTGGALYWTVSDAGWMAFPSQQALVPEDDAPSTDVYLAWFR